MFSCWNSMPLWIPVAIAARISNGNIITGVWWLSLSCENCILKFKFKMLIHHIYVILQCFICNWILHLFKMKSNAMRCHAHRNADISAFKYFEDSEWHKQQIHAMAQKSVWLVQLRSRIFTRIRLLAQRTWCEYLKKRTIFPKRHSAPLEDVVVHIDVNVDVDNLCNTWTLFQMRVISIGYLLHQRFRALSVRM